MAPSNEKPLRQLAAEKIHGKGSNPSQLGDPISLKAESANSSPTENDRGAQSNQTSPQTTARIPESSGGSHEEKKLKGGKTLRGMMTDDIKKLNNGEGEVNRTMLGDPTSLKAETSRGSEGQGDNGPSEGRRDSKL